MAGAARSSYDAANSVQVLRPTASYMRIDLNGALPTSLAVSAANHALGITT
jgi:hypothetical protein